MTRLVSLFLFLAIARAQDKPTDQLAPLRQTADKAATAWQALAKGLEPRIARLLPCDPNSRAAIEEVSRASEARLSTLAEYLKAAVTKAKDDTDAAKQVLASQAALAGGWNTERAEAHLESVTIDAQIADLKESMRKRAALASAQRVLIELSRMVKERAAKSEEQAGRKDSIVALLGDLVLACQDRQNALENESALVDAEAVKWKSYYAARLSRGATECAIINPGLSRRKRQP